MRTQTFVAQVPFCKADLEAFISEMEAREGGSADLRREHLLQFPTVYVVHRPHDEQYDVYVGETSDIQRRTVEHLINDSRSSDSWKDFAESESAEMLVIGHSHFNKSLTLDVENRLIQWLLGSPAVHEVHNRRTNPQNKYYTRDELDDTFHDIWRRLRRVNKRLFPDEQIIRNSALFKASPFHRLTDEQIAAKRRIHESILTALEERVSGRLVIVEGAAGTGKTVLLSSLFFELFQGEQGDDDPFAFRDLDAYLLVNHDEQITVYQQIAAKLGLPQTRPRRVAKPTAFINQHAPGSDVDVVLVDEAHLLWTQGKQSYRGENMLLDLLDRAKVVVAVYDPAQAIATNQYWEPELLSDVYGRASEVLQLSCQLRISSGEATWQWIQDVVHGRRIGPIPDDDRYDLRVFDDPGSLHAAIKERAQDEEHGLSRLLATFDWPYSSGKPPASGSKWTVDIADFSLPWNLQYESTRAERRRLGRLAWAEHPKTVDEVGSIFTIQGFDLNYAGLIIGPSVRYVDGEVVFDSSASANRHATQQRSLRDRTTVDVSEDLLRNQLNILMTRGVNGLYLYAVDPGLQAALRRAAGRGQGHD